MDSVQPSKTEVPIWGILSITLTPITVLCAILAVVTLETLVVKSGGSLSTLFPGVARASVAVMALCVLEGLVAAVVALILRERPRWLPLIGLATTASIFAVFLYFE